MSWFSIIVGTVGILIFGALFAAIYISGRFISNNLISHHHSLMQKEKSD